MRIGFAIALALSFAGLGLGGCASLQPRTKTVAAACPAGQEQLRTVHLFLGKRDTAWPVRDADLKQFVDDEITPRFPDGVTVLDGGGQWKGPEDQLLRDAAKVVTFILPAGSDFLERIDAVRTAYQTRFRQESVLVVARPGCVGV